MSDKALKDLLESKTGQPIPANVLSDIAAAPATTGAYAPPEKPKPVSEDLLRRAAIAIVLGVQMPKFRTAAEREAVDKLRRDIEFVMAQDGIVELPFDLA